MEPKQRSYSSPKMLLNDVLWILGVVLFSCALANCSEINKDPVVVSHAEAGFEIMSGRNSTGHWNSKLRFVHSANRGHLEGEQEIDAWKMKFDQKIDVTEEGEKISLYASVTIPPAGTEVSRPFLEIDDPAPDTTVKHRKLAEHGYQFVDGVGYYKFHSTPATWYSALVKCQQEGAHLLIINSEDEARVARSLFATHPTITGANNNNLAFIGVNDIENEGVYITIFGEALQDTGYRAWKSNQPNNYGSEPPGEDCVTIDRDALLYDWECYVKLAFICEQSL